MFVCHGQIPLVIDLPVGNNLQDHVMSDGIEFFTPHAGVSITAVKAENFLQSWSYSLFGAGAANCVHSVVTSCLALFSHMTRAFNIYLHLTWRVWRMRMCV